MGDALRNYMTVGEIHLLGAYLRESNNAFAAPKGEWVTYTLIPQTPGEAPVAEFCLPQGGGQVRILAGGQVAMAKRTTTDPQAGVWVAGLRPGTARLEMRITRNNQVTPPEVATLTVGAGDAWAGFTPNTHSFYVDGGAQGA